MYQVQAHATRDCKRYCGELANPIHFVPKKMFMISKKKLVLVLEFMNRARANINQ